MLASFRKKITRSVASFVDVAEKIEMRIKYLEEMENKRASALEAIQMQEHVAKQKEKIILDVGMHYSNTIFLVLIPWQGESGLQQQNPHWCLEKEHFFTQCWLITDGVLVKMEGMPSRLNLGL